MFDTPCLPGTYWKSNCLKLNITIILDKNNRHGGMIVKPLFYKIRQVKNGFRQLLKSQTTLT